MNQVSITVPLEKNALLRASEMLAGLAADQIEVTARPQMSDAKCSSADVEAVTAEQVFGGKAISAGIAEGAAQAVGSVTASTAAEPVTNDTPLPPATPVTALVDTTLTSMTTANAGGVDLDKDGLPWDVRIHASSKEKVKDGSWKLKRGVDKLLVEDVKAELRGVMSIPTPDATTPPPPASGAKITTFAQLMPAITAAKLDAAYVTPIIQQLGIASMPLLATRPDLIPAVAEALGLS